MAQFPHASVPGSLQIDDRAAAFLEDVRQIVKSIQVIGDGIFWATGTGSPEGVVAGRVGSLYSRLDGGTNTTLYVKQSGTGTTGWAAK